MCWSKFLKGDWSMLCILWSTIISWGCFSSFIIALGTYFIPDIWTVICWSKSVTWTCLNHRYIFNTSPRCGCQKTPATTSCAQTPPAALQSRRTLDATTWRARGATLTCAGPASGSSNQAWKYTTTFPTAQRTRAYTKSVKNADNIIYLMLMDNKKNILEEVFHCIRGEIK